MFYDKFFYNKRTECMIEYRRSCEGVVNLIPLVAWSLPVGTLLYKFILICINVTQISRAVLNVSL
jgi:hypothetical protein